MKSKWIFKYSTTLFQNAFISILRTYINTSVTDENVILHFRKETSYTKKINKSLVLIVIGRK